MSDLKAKYRKLTDRNLGNGVSNIIKIAINEGLVYNVGKINLPLTISELITLGVTSKHLALPI